MAEGNDINEMVKVQDGKDCHQGNQNNQLFVLLLRVPQANGKPLSISGCTAGAMAQMLHEIAGVVPKEVVVLTDQVVMTFEEEASMTEVSRAVHGFHHWGGQSINVDCLVAGKDSITEIVREQEISGRNRRN